jgi:hypothetical protein
MWAIIKRATLPVLLLFCGGTLVVYGTAFHTVTVVEEQEVEETITIPSPFELPPLFPDQPSEFPEQPPEFPEPPPFFPEPPPIVETVIVTLREFKKDSEPRLIRETTIGGVAFIREEDKRQEDKRQEDKREEDKLSIFGVTLLASGELKRTYSGEAPSLCPT